MKKVLRAHWESLDSAKLNDWLQVVRLLGFISSLLFVGMQRKNNK